MPFQIIGEFGSPGANREWLSAQATLAIRHIVQWMDHDLGSYPVIVLTWVDAMRGSPAKYVGKCEAALFEFENGEPMPYLPCWWNDEEEQMENGED